MNESTDAVPNWPEGDITVWNINNLVVYPFILLVGGVGNILVIYINHFRLPSNTDTYFKKTIAAFDLIDLCTSMPLLIYISVEPATPLYNIFCRILSFFALWSNTMAGDVLVVVSFDRFLKLCLLRKSGMQMSIVKRVLLTLILFTVSCNLPCFWLFSKSVTYFPAYQVKVSYCFLDFMTSNPLLLQSFSLYIIFLSLAGLTLMVFFYARIVLKLRELSRNHRLLKGRPGVDEETRPKEGNRQARAMKRSSLVFVAVTISYFSCYVPYGMVLLGELTQLLVVGRLSPGAKAVYDLGKNSPMFTHMMNPLIFLLSSKFSQK